MPAFVLASPLAASEAPAAKLDTRNNRDHIHCTNAPGVVAGYMVSASDIVNLTADALIPDATDKGYFRFLWCGAGSKTYVFIDPLGGYAHNKGNPDIPIFSTGLGGAHDLTQNGMKGNVASDAGNAIGDGNIVDSNGGHNYLIADVPVAYLSPASGIGFVRVFAQDSVKRLTWGVAGAAFTILKDFVTLFPLYADAMYFQIGDDAYGTVGNGYMGLIQTGSTKCYLKGSEAQQNTVPCEMPKDYPNY